MNLEDEFAVSDSINITLTIATSERNIEVQYENRTVIVDAE